MASPVDQLKQQFIAAIAAKTGLDPAVVEQWTAREGAYASGGTGGLNFLNLRPYKSDTGVVARSPGGFDQFGSLPAAVDSTVARIKQPFLQQYLAPALAQGPAAQWDAITKSGWSADHYGAAGGSTTPDSVGGVTAPQSAQPDLAGAREQLLSFLMGNLRQHDHPDPAMFAGELKQLAPLIQPGPVTANPGSVSVAGAPTSAADMSGPAGSAGSPPALANIPDQIATRTGITVDQAILPAVSRIVQAFGVKVNSGYRSPEHNAEVGGAPQSDHLHGDAVDFTGPPDAMAALYEWAQGKFPYVEPMSQAHDHVHISFLRG